MWETGPQHQKNPPEKSHYGVSCNPEKIIYILLKHKPYTHRHAHTDTQTSLWILGTSTIYKGFGISLHQDHNL